MVIYLCQEEDLFTMAYGLPLSGNGDEKCLSMLNAVEETISRQLRACKASSSKRRVSEGNWLFLDRSCYWCVLRLCFKLFFIVIP